MTTFSLESSTFSAGVHAVAPASTMAVRNGAVAFPIIERNLDNFIVLCPCREEDSGRGLACRAPAGEFQHVSFDLESGVFGEPVRKALHVLACEVDYLSTTGTHQMVVVFLWTAEEVRRLATVHGNLAHHVQVGQHAKGSVDSHQPYVTPFALHDCVKLGRC